MKLQPITINLEWIIGKRSHGSFEGTIELENDANLMIFADVLCRKSGHLIENGIDEPEFIEDNIEHPIIIYTIDVYDLESGMEVEFNRTEIENLIKITLIYLYLLLV